MAVIRTEALQRFADRIAACVPELTGRICGGAAEAPHQLAFPNLAIIAVRWRFLPDQVEEFKQLNSSTAIFEVGEMEATVQMRLGAQNYARRAELEQAIMEKVFWADLEHPGVVAFPLEACHDALVAFELGDDEWEDEKAFDKKWYSILTVDAFLPALVTQKAYTIEEVRLVLTEDLTTPIVTVPFSGKETISIDEDGNMTTVASP